MAWPEGVTESVLAKMNALHAGSLREDGLILRRCEHGVKHPVGHIHTNRVGLEESRSHEQRCCPDACCKAWAVE